MSVSDHSVKGEGGAARTKAITLLVHSIIQPCSIERVVTRSPCFGPSSGLGSVFVARYPWIYGDSSKPFAARGN